MGSTVDRFFGNATSTTLWRSPRGTVLRIEALALVAITFSFFLAAFGSCRRWSNKWIVQKGFLLAQPISLSLGTYSIGLMQSSSVKSEMYPIWAVSLLTLFGCVDPVTTYIGLDYKGPLLKIIFPLCLYCGYVVLISVSTISSVVGNLAIGVLSAITFIKGFHRSLALVLPSTTRDEMGELLSTETSALVGDGDGAEGLKVHLPLYLQGILETPAGKDCVTMADIHKHMGELKLPEVTANGLTIQDVCLGYSLSHLLQRHFLRLGSSKEMEEKIKVFERLAGVDGRPETDYTRILKVIEVELGFLYEVYFSSNEFLHLYQAKTGSFWALASFLGICFVGVASVIPSSHHRSIATSSSGPPGAVYTTTADLIITLVILLSLALLQLVQLMCSWTSNWARVSFACEYARNRKLAQEKSNSEREQIRPNSEKKQIGPWMWLKVLIVTRMNRFDKYLWQDQLGQLSVVDAVKSRSQRFSKYFFGPLFWGCGRSLVKTGATFVLRVLTELLGSTTNWVAAVGLHDDVKTSVADFLGQIKSGRIGKDWSSLFVDNGLDTSFLPYYSNNRAPYELPDTVSDGFLFTHRVLVWHVATRYCEEAEKEEGTAVGGEDGDREKNRRVAIALSKYCAYLAASAPELLPGSSEEIKRVFGTALTYSCVHGEALGKWLRNEDTSPRPGRPERMRRRSDDPWKVLALLWVQTLLYAAPYGDVQAHMQHLSQGGEFITHLWALLYHLGIDKWEQEEETA